ncbi:PaaI family thioesterase [Nocardioides sp. NPDC057577]|uniref:PaaI family thioesterase n=1 Tax=Nocardioides sp. NPDC057577 TaxID=3346171 RepID=UPI00366BED32
MTLTPEHTDELAEEVAALASATRRLMLAAATADLDVDELRAARTRMDALTDELGRRSRARVLRADFHAPARAREAGPDRPLPIFRFNPQALPLALHLDGDTARARTVPNALYEGPPDSVHGGFLAHLMDCMLGTLVQATGRRAVTATLDMRYRARTPLDVPVDLAARIVKISGRKIVAESWVEVDGERTVEATGLFIELEEIPWATS